MLNIIKLVKKPISPQINEIIISKRACGISMIFCAIQFIYCCICLLLLKNSYLYTDYFSKTSTGTGVHRFILGATIAIPTFIALFIFLKVTKQDISSIGFKRIGIKSSLFIGIGLFALFISKYLAQYSLSIDLFYNIIFYLIFTGLFEEVMFRGLMWPRLQLLLGNRAGFIICGLLFGLWHVPLQIIWNNFSLFDVFIMGASTNSNILSGIIGQLIFGYIYTRNDNILLPSFIHGIVDLTSVL